MYSRNHGSAILSALFLMTLVAIAATAMSTRLQLDIYRTHLTMRSDRILLASQAIGYWAMNSLVTTDKKFLLKGEDGLVLRSPSSVSHLYPDLTINAKLYDMQGRFNLNNLQDGNYHLLFLRLIKNIIKKIEETDAKSIVESTAHWVRPYNPALGFDDDMEFYDNQKPPYVPGFQPMQSITEFRMVYGVTAPIYRALKPYIAALPTTTPINVNTASPQVIKILGKGLDDAQLTEFLQLRQSKGRFDSKDIATLVSRFGLTASQISIESQYYLCVATISGTGFQTNYYMLLRRIKDKDGKYSIGVLSETINAL